MRVDPSGRCYYNANGQWCHDNWEYLGGYERKPDPGTYKEKPTDEAPKNVATSLWENFEASLGVGLGLYVETEVLDVGVAGGLYYNPLYLEVDDGDFKIYQEYYTGFTASVLTLNFGSTERRTRTYTTIDPTVVNKGVFSEETITIFSIAGYVGGGFSFRIGFDLNSFLADMDELYS